MRKIKVFFYWCSVVPVLVDLVKGAVSGVRKGLADLQDARMQERFDLANKGLLPEDEIAIKKRSGK